MASFGLFLLENKCRNFVWMLINCEEMTMDGFVQHRWRYSRSLCCKRVSREGGHKLINEVALTVI